ncbi:methionine aminopeptidase 2-like protein [Thermoascus aurantiacus ATCC 26904]
MGSKTYEGQRQHHNEETTSPTTPKLVGGKPRGASLAEDGDVCYGNGDDDDDDEKAPAAEVIACHENSGENKKRKKAKKKKNKKKQAEKGAAASSALKQTSPPRVLLSDLFPSGNYPPGEYVEYSNDGKDENLQRTTNEELRYLSRLHIDDEKFLNDYRKAAEVHREVRQWVQQTVKPGQTLREIAEGIEDGVRALLGHQGLEPGDSLIAGMGFPTGLALNNCVAHYTPNPGQTDIVLQHDDVMKVDFGVHVNGWIVDSAFTMTFDPVYDNLVAAVKEATNTGVKHAGIDARMSDIGSAIQEVMESYEVEIKGKTYGVKAIRNITGHSIEQYRIHGKKSVPFVKNSDQTKMEEGDIFAIETFGSTGKGYFRDGVGVYGYGKNPDAPNVPLNLSSARSLLKTINENFGTIVFCRRYLDRLGLDKYLVGMNSLITNGIVDMYPPLNDVEGSYTAQFEHTVLIRSAGKEVISRGDDY